MRAGVVDEEHEVRVPDAGRVTAVGRAVERRLEVERARRVERDLERVEGDRSHVDGRVHDGVGRRVELEVDLAPAAVGVDDQPLAVADPGAVRDPGEAARAVAAHLGPAAVGVEQDHGAVGAVGAGLDRDQPVGADPRWRSQSATASAGAIARSPVPVHVTRKSLPVAWSLASVSGAVTDTTMPAVRAGRSHEFSGRRTR